MRLFKMAFLALVVSAGPAMAAEILGMWERSDGASRVKITSCGGGGAVCGHVSWLRDPAKSPSKVGQRVFYDMKPDGGGWTGSAFNPEDGKTYTGKASVSGSSMTTQGCVLGGLICKNVAWNRVN